MPHVRRRWLATLFCLPFWAAGPAQAQDAPPPEPAPAEGTPAEAPPAETVQTIPVKETSAPAPASGADQTQLDAVIVTARRRQETLQEVPVSVTAFSAKQMDRRGFTSISDIAAATPGFTFESLASGNAHSNPVIRGLANQFYNTRIQNVSFFLDGVYIQRQSMMNLGMIDMERIEVVKGPQNALYGRNAFAGAVNYVTQEPYGNTEGYVSALVGDNARRELRASVTGPIPLGDSLFGKFTLGSSNYDGDAPNHHPINCPGIDAHHACGNLGGWDDLIYSGSLSWLGLGDTLKLRGSYYYNKQVHESPASYSISGVNVTRFGLRYDYQNDLNCNRVTVPDISDPDNQGRAPSHTGNSLWCGQLPRYASDVAPRTVPGTVIDPRAIGSVATSKVFTFNGSYELTPAIDLRYTFGHIGHASYTDGGASDEDPLAGRGIVTNAAAWEADNTDPNGYTFVNTSSSRPNSELTSMSHEIRMDWKYRDGLRLGAGAYYEDVKDSEWTQLFIMDLCNTASAQNIANCNSPITKMNTVADSTVLTAGVAWDQYTRQAIYGVRGEWTQFHDQVMAVFGSVNYDFTDTLEGALEARYNLEDKAVTRLTDGFALEPGRTVTYNPPQDPVLPVGNSLTSQIVVPHDRAKFSDITPRAILSWKWEDAKMVYGSIAKGIKAGGFNNAQAPEELKYAQETNWTYELGSKNQFFHHLFTVNASVYYTDWSRMQAGVPPRIATLSTSDVITNIPGATNKGIELETLAHLTEAFSIDASLSLSDPKYKDGVTWGAGTATGNFHCDSACPPSGDVSGHQIMRTSKQQASAGLNYVSYLYEWTLNSRLDATYRSKQYVEPLNLGWVPARTLVNASMSFVSPGTSWEVGAWGKNLTNVDYASNAILIGVFNQYLVGKGPLRTFGLNVKYKF